MHEHVVDDVVGHRAEPARQPDAAIGGRARTPAPLLVVHPLDARGDGGTVEMGGRQCRCAGHQLVVPTERAAPALLAGLQLGHHLGDPPALLGVAERRGDQHDRAAHFAVGRHGPATPGTAADLDHVVLARRLIRRHGAARPGGRPHARGPAVRRRNAGGLGVRVTVVDRSGHGGTVSHCGRNAPPREHPLVYRSHGRWNEAPLSPVTSARIGLVHNCASPSSRRSQPREGSRSHVGSPARPSSAHRDTPMRPHDVHSLVHRLWGIGPPAGRPGAPDVGECALPPEDRRLRARVACLRNGDRRVPRRP